MNKNNKELTGWRLRVHKVVFESNTLAGKIFDISLVILILLSILIVILESIDHWNALYYREFRIIEWIFTSLFTIEYILRLFSIRRPRLYAFSFFGVIDLLAILPSYLELFFPGGGHVLLILRVFRLLRVFRIFKMTRYIKEGKLLWQAIKASVVKMTIFIFVVSMTVVTIGSLMYLVEGPKNGFTSIPVSMYWAIVTITTVGFGDIVPKTFFGQILSSFLMLLGYGLIAVPTGIFSVEMLKEHRKRTVNLKACYVCGNTSNDPDAVFCKICGGKV